MMPYMYVGMYTIVPNTEVGCSWK